MSQTIFRHFFSRELKTEILIDAPKEVVWKILCDLSQYSKWNSFLPEADGTVKPNAVIGIMICPAGEKARPYKVRVTSVEELAIFSWRGHFVVPGLIDGDHTFELKSQGSRQTLFVQRESFTGFLVPFVWETFLNTKLRAGFVTMNGELKRLAEQCV